MPGVSRSSVVTLVGALGVVFGDIGTSPLYALRSILGEATTLDSTTILGLTSLIIWSLVSVVAVLYVGLLLRTDNEGEGGLLALLGLVRRTGTGARTMTVVTVLAMVGAAMFLGDSVITPAISVLSAAEGLTVASPSLGTFVLPVALVILVGVFVLQRVGSGTIGRFYGPVMVLWFLVLAGGGAASLSTDPGVVQAVSPIWAVRFVAADPLTAFLSLGSVILVVTGAEALYADLGHFGRAAITRAWLLLVLPALTLAYLGEAAEVMRHHGAASDPFYAVVPSWATIPVLVLATMATVIASEAVIAGAFTVLHQAGGLGLLPYLRIRHTSRTRSGQIYMPAANWALAVAVPAVVAGFGSSERLSAAYGVAVSVTILMTVTLYLVLDHARAGRTTARGMLGAAMGLVVLCFVLASGPKLVSGGWAPTAIGLVMVVVMSTWWHGRRRLEAARREVEEPATRLLRELSEDGDHVHRSRGSAVFLTDDSEVAPLALRTMMERTEALPERVVLLSWRVEDTPRARADDVTVDVDRFSDVREGVLGVDVSLGYRERLEVGNVLRRACEQEPRALAGIDADTTTYVVSEPIPRLSPGCGMARWRQRLFLTLDRMSTDRVDQLELPRDRTIVIGRELDL